MRAQIDITEVEAATKIRAKYLRALENEEWDLLPGPTFVKTFLRTYGEYLGLDARLLVEEYRQRYERPSDAGPAAVRPRRSAAARAAPPRAPRVRAPAGARRRALVALLGALVRARHAGATTTAASAAPTRGRPPPQRQDAPPRAAASARAARERARGGATRAAAARVVVLQRRPDRRGLRVPGRRHAAAG